MPNSVDTDRILGGSPAPIGGWTFREVDDENALEAVFRLRYRAFTASEEHAEAVAQGASALDVTRWDGPARHYAVFDGAGRPAATLRAVGAGTAKTCDAVERLLADHPSEHGAYRAAWYPMLGLIDPSWLTPEVLGWFERAERLIEFSRVATDPDLGTRRPAAFRQLAEGALAAEFFLHGTERAIGLSPVPLAPVYEAFGFTRAESRQPMKIFSSRLPSVIVSLDRATLAYSALAPRLAALAREIERGGSYTRPAPRGSR